MFRPLRMGLFAAALAAAAGCQGEKSPYTFAPVEGTVTKGGKPLPGVVVLFWGDAEAGTTGPLSSGPTDAAGHYHLHTEQGVDGALVGRHRVCIIETDVLIERIMRRNSAKKDMLKGAAPAGPAVVPANYALKEDTPLRAEVQAGGGQVIDFEVK
jgi:hypothetical protein